MGARLPLRVVAWLAAFAVAAFAGCASERAGFDVAGGNDGGSSGDFADGGAECRELRCKQVLCEDGKTTTVTGKVYAPNGTLPLYNVVVYVPNRTPDALPEGTSCDRCGVVASGEPIVSALTDATGAFRLENVPAGSSIPLVMQLGKWRRQIVLPEVKACDETAIADANLTRLPRKRAEGDMPRIAVTTGAADQLACLLPKLGIDRTELGPGGTTNGYAVEFFSGALMPGYPATAPTGSPDARVLWDDVAKLRQYDMVVLSCEGYEATTGNTDPAYDAYAKPQTATSYTAMAQYLAEGGRVFTTDFEYTWFKYATDPGLKSAMTIPGGAFSGASPMDLDMSFPKGKALADWLKVVEPTSELGKLTTDVVFDNVSAASPAAQVWARSGSPANPRIVTVNTPVGSAPEQQCGKAVHLDAHINRTDRVTPFFPDGCTSPLGQGEKAFSFFFFDLASCIQKESDAPSRPPTVN